MDREKLKDFLEEKLQDDPLYKTLVRMGLKEHIYQGSLFQQVHLESTYSTREATFLLDLDGRDYQIRNYIKRNDLHVYLDVPRVGHQLRLDILSLFKFKMIFVLVEQGGKSPIDIASIVGTRVESYSPQRAVNSSKNTINSSNLPSTESSYTEELEDMQDKLDNLQNMFLLNQINQQKREWHEKIDAAEKQKVEWERAISDVIEKIEIIEWTNNLQKQAATNPKVTKELLKKIDSERPKESLWSKLFGVKSIQVDLETMFEEVSKMIEEEASSSPGIPEELSEKYTALKNKRSELEKKKEEVYLAVQKAKEQYLPMINQLEKKSNDILSRLDTEDQTFKAMLEVSSGTEEE
ncbi:hypothetical protein K7887_22570 (plasmid) [Sutcliffiella horikoshii]|uniref:coiled-coil domain-containing protein n=1 Tax=Sutcliffiella horikoshii TaxID=79883 RepID=UPI001CBDA663|nr:hypothetical protein [Sutcliffiella horikoshii]UAL49753.1 hypothetical protein K7887_22570 [Sutcliffiella horikoshii]